MKRLRVGRAIRISNHRRKARDQVRADARGEVRDCPDIKVRGEGGRKLIAEDRAEDGHADCPSHRAEQRRACGRDAEVAIVDGVLDGQDQHLHHEAEPQPEEEHVEIGDECRRARGEPREQHMPTTISAVPTIGNTL